MGNPSADQLDRIDRTISYVDDHLGDPLDLEALASIACFSKFHFHRIFKLVAGVSPQEYVKRRRLEMAYHFLSNDSGLSVQEMSDLLGFSSPSNFARSFRELYAFPPGRFRSPGFHPPGRPPAGVVRPFSMIDPALVTLEVLEAFRVVYRRVRCSPPVDREGVEATFAALRLECVRRGWSSRGAREVVIGKSIPGINDPAKLVFDYGIEVPPSANTHDATHMQTVPAGTYARYEHRGDPAKIADCWTEFYLVWLKRSGLSAGKGFGFTVLASEATRGSFLLYQPVRSSRALGRR
jgi:AraC family transcriptional regulator